MGVTFYQGEAFPPEYRDAFLVGDWSRGRILAGRQQGSGASYTETISEFVLGTPAEHHRCRSGAGRLGLLRARWPAHQGRRVSRLAPGGVTRPPDAACRSHCPRAGAATAALGIRTQGHRGCPSHRGRLVGLGAQGHRVGHRPRATPRSRAGIAACARAEAGHRLADHALRRRRQRGASGRGPPTRPAPYAGGAHRAGRAAQGPGRVRAASRRRGAGALRCPSDDDAAVRSGRRRAAAALEPGPAPPLRGAAPASPGQPQPLARGCARDHDVPGSGRRPGRPGADRTCADRRPADARSAVGADHCRRGGAGPDRRPEGHAPLAHPQRRRAVHHQPSPRSAPPCSRSSPPARRRWIATSPGRSPTSALQAPSPRSSPP